MRKIIHSEVREENLSKDEKKYFNHLLEMMIDAKAHILLYKRLHHEKEK